MNILLIDDDHSMIDMLMTSIDWNSLNIDPIYKAYNAKQAKEVFACHSVDIMLCDIEMPNCTGIELLEWVRENNYDTQAIFLTNHAEFHLAQEALRLGSFDFITKTTTIEAITDVIKRAIDIVKSVAVKEMYHSLGQHWENSKHFLYNQFYEQILYGNIIGENESIELAANSRNLSIDTTEKYYMLLISTDGSLLNAQNWSTSELSFTLKNIMSEFFFDTVTSPYIINISNNTNIDYVLLLPSDLFIDTTSSLEQRCVQLSDIYNNILDTSVYFYYSDIIDLADIHQTGKLLHKMKLNNVTNKQCQSMDSLITTNAKTVKVPLFDFSMYYEDMLVGNTLIVLNKFKVYLSGIDKSSLDASMIQSMSNHYNQLLFTAIKQKSYKLNEFIMTESDHRLHQNSTKTLYDFMKWMNISMKKMQEFSITSKHYSNVVEEIIDYIPVHLHENLNKTTLANVAHLNPDYFAKLFKKETGDSLTNYVNNARITKSKELLSNPGLSLSIVANQVGFDNYSYYSSVFKKITGISPKSYRNKILSL